MTLMKSPLVPLYKGETGKRSFSLVKGDREGFNHRG